MKQYSQNIQKLFSSRNNGYLMIIFLFWPFFAFLIACTDFRNKLNRKIILAFCILYGTLFFINVETDSQRRMERFKEIYNEPVANFFQTINNLYKETTDIVEPFIMYLVSRFTDSFNFLFSIYALIFGSLMIYYLKRMHSHYVINRNRNAFLFFILLICINPINEINGFRMWTGAWVFAIGVMKYLHKPRLKYLILVAFSILIHFSYMPAVILFVIYAIFKNRIAIYGILATISFFIAELNIEQIRQYAILMGNASEKKIEAYTNEEYIEKVSELGNQSAWYIQFIEKGILYFTIISLLYIYLKTKGRFKEKITANFYSVSLLLLTFANISSLLPSGFRFYKIFYIFSFSTLMLFYVYEYQSKKISNLNLIGYPIAFLFIFLSFRIFADSASLYLFGPSFFMPFGITENESLKSLLF